MSTSRRRLIHWLEKRLNLTEIFSFVSTFGLAYGEIDTQRPVEDAVEDAFTRPHPVYVRWPYILGILAFLLFLFQVVTGSFLAFYYQPTTESAYESVLVIMRDTSLGWYFHQMHHWGSHILVGLLILRLCRFFLHGAYKKPRELLWVFAVLLFLLSMHGALTGSLLPWDQNAYWSVTLALEALGEVPILGPLYGALAGGIEIHNFTITRFYVLHVLAIPLATFVLFYLQFATIRRIGLSTVAEGRPSPMRPLFPDHILNLVTVVLLLFGCILALAVFAPAVFHAEADPFTSPVGAMPPWYIAPGYALGDLLPRQVAGIVILIFSVLGFAVPFLDRSGDRRLSRKPVILSIFLLGWLLLLWLTYTGYAATG